MMIRNYAHEKPPSSKQMCSIIFIQIGSQCVEHAAILIWPQLLFFMVGIPQVSRDRFPPRCHSRELTSDCFIICLQCFAAVIKQ